MSDPTFYRFIRSLLFTLDGESAHNLSLSLMKRLLRTPLACFLPNRSVSDPTTVMGLNFSNKVGLAAGLDKNGEFIEVFSRMGFGFIEVGTVTPQPQPGNPLPRLFRIPERQALINRMGFNNHGVAQLLTNIRQSRFRQNGGILGINIGKNAVTPMEQAVDDYLYCLRMVYNDASYITINISSPNTKNLRDLQSDAQLDQLLSQLKACQNELAEQASRYVPMALKIAQDLNAEQIQVIADAVRRHRFDAVIATNTTLSREGVEACQFAGETGGLSGRPLQAKSTEVIRQLAAALGGACPIIAVGGIMDGAAAAEKIAAGAALVQLYTGLIYQGPGLVNEVAQALAQPAAH